ncbi:ubiquitin fusion degradation protein UFD1-domain-containing protein, partial [Fimicolochytrium jonesii]|uniref:ubiquitin fusion degradation protein UFD1-domain-containing protein n=1 Tax=Fimicolochytrium jonesii TaxID=1396493 RepID=UPI0022FF1229
WTRLLRAQTVETLTGDRVNLPADLLHSLVGNDDRHAHPLTFQLVSPHTSLKVYATVREFTADEGTIQLGKPLAESLGLLNLPPTDNDDNKALDVRLTTVTLPCGTYAKLAPLDADYLEIADIRSTLESHLRRNYATLTQGQILAITEIHRSTRQAHEHRFLVAELRAESKDTIPGCLILDQDVVVDIEPLDIGLAEAAVRKKFTPQQAGGGGGGPIQLSWDAEGRTASSLSPYSVKADEYIYFQIPTTPSPSTYTIEVDPHHGDADVFLSTTLEKPSIMDHSAYNVDVGRSVVSLEVPDPTQAPILHIGVLGVSPTSEFQLHVRVDDLSAKTTDEPVPPPPEPTTEPPPGTTRCTNCGAHIPSQTLPMHLAFCLRNNTTCPHCHTTLLKSQAADHWHCGFC